MSALIIRLGGAQALPVDVLLSSIPSLPRHVLDRLVERAIDRLDQMDGDIDLEPEHDFGADDQGEAGSWPEHSDQPRDGHAYADDDHEEDAAALKLHQDHRDRIRQTRCDPLTTPRGYLIGYRLKPPLE